MDSSKIPIEDLDINFQQKIAAARSARMPVFLTGDDATQGVFLDFESYQEIISCTLKLARIIGGAEKGELAEAAENIKAAGEQLCSAAEKVNDLQESYIELLRALASAMESHESYLHGHNERLAIFACETARQLGCSEEEVENIHWAALLHDIGEVIIPTYVLQKSTGLAQEEWEFIRDHPRVGAEFVNKIHKLEKAADIIYAHQEKYDGSGYPEGLKGDEIPLGARILSIADTYDAITNLRLHKDSGNHQEAVEELEKYSGKYYDPAIVEVFLSIF